jgi:hypothetical protein
MLSQPFIIVGAAENITMAFMNFDFDCFDVITHVYYVVIHVYYSIIHVYVYYVMIYVFPAKESLDYL